MRIGIGIGVIFVGGSPPLVAITSPAAGSTVYEGKALTISGTCSDDGTVAGVEVFAGATSLGAATLVGDGTWTRSWTPTAGQVGAQNLTAVATDNAGVLGTSAAVGITVGTWLDRINALSPSSLYYGLNGLVDSANAEPGDQYSRWTDLSGNGNHATQATADDEPTGGTDAQGRQYLAFDGADGTSGDAFTIPTAISGVTAITVVHAIDLTGVASEKYIESYDNSTVYCTYGNSGNYLWSWGAIASIAATAAKHCFVMRYDGGAAHPRVRLYKDGVSGGTIGTFPTAMSAVNTGALGRGSTSKALAITAKYYLRARFNRALSDPDLTELHAALQYGLGWW